MPYALVILCGGKSTRMGTDKALLPFGQKSLIEYLVDKFHPYFSSIYLSVQQQGDYSSLQLPVKYVADIYQNAGALSGIFSALSMMKEDRAFFITVDTPFVEPQLGISLLTASEGYDICAIRRKNLQTETLSAVYSKNVTPRAGKALILKQYSLNLFLENCSTTYVPEEDLDGKCSTPVSLQFFNMNTRSDYYRALHFLWRDGKLPTSNHSDDTSSLFRRQESSIPILSFVGDSLIDKKNYVEQLSSILDKDNIKNAIFHYDENQDPAAQRDALRRITNVDLILTYDLKDLACFKIEMLLQETNRNPLYKENELMAYVTDFNYKSVLPTYDYRKLRSIVPFIRNFVKDYGN